MVQLLCRLPQHTEVHGIAASGPSHQLRHWRGELMQTAGLSLAAASQQRPLVSVAAAAALATTAAVQHNMLPAHWQAPSAASPAGRWQPASRRRWRSRSHLPASAVAQRSQVQWCNATCCTPNDSDPWPADGATPFVVYDPGGVLWRHLVCAHIRSQKTIWDIETAVSGSRLSSTACVTSELSVLCWLPFARGHDDTLLEQI